MVTECFIESAEAKLRVRIEGAGPAVMLLHGFGGDLTTWAPLWSALSADNRCIGLDLRGFGESRHKSEKRFAHHGDVVAVLDWLGIAQCDLVGVSQGGSIALDVALANHDRVRSLSLISPGVSGWQWSAEWRARWGDIVQSARGGNMEGARRSWWANPLFDSLRNRDMAAEFEAGIMHYSGREWIRDYQSIENPAVDRLEQVQMPALLMSGGRDIDDFMGIASHIADHVPHCSTALHTDLGHLLHLEDPAWLLRQLQPFLAGLR